MDCVCACVTEGKKGKKKKQNERQCMKESAEIECCNVCMNLN